jgi:hypothetical protein
LTILFQDTNPLPKEKPVSLLPLLTVLFILSYGMLTYLVMQQASTIDSQRILIRQLLGDSVELSAMKGKAIQAQNPRGNQPPAQEQPQTDSAKPKGGAVRKAQPDTNRRQMPEKPSKNTGVVLDTRRVTLNL